MSKPSGTNYPKTFRMNFSYMSWPMVNRGIELVGLEILDILELLEQLASHKEYLGGYRDGVHLFPFRTEKLSPPSLMILHLFVEK